MQTSTSPRHQFDASLPALSPNFLLVAVFVLHFACGFDHHGLLIRELHQIDRPWFTKKRLGIVSLT